MKRLVLHILLASTGMAASGCAVVSTVGAIGGAGVSAATTAGGLAISGAGATLSAASSAARAAPTFHDTQPADEE